MGSWYQLTQEAALRPPAGLATSLGLPLRLRAEEGRRGAGGGGWESRGSFRISFHSQESTGLML